MGKEVKVARCAEAVAYFTYHYGSFNLSSSNIHLCNPKWLR